MSKITRALVSVSDKMGIVEFVSALQKRGVEILSTGGTAKVLADAGLQVIDVAKYTNSPEMLNGRVKTLHPKIHGGILGRRDDETHVEQMIENDIGLIDMVVVNLYPFEATVAKSDCSLEDAIENIDIGGPAMIRSAAKNHEHVAVVTDSADYNSIISEMDANNGTLTAATKFKFAKKAFATTARYDSAIINYLTKLDDSKKTLEWPSDLGLSFKLVQPLRYGENPHQRAAFYGEFGTITEPSIANACQIQGKELSYNNIMDADAVIEIVRGLTGNSFASVIVKHANPCGAAISEKSLSDAFLKSRECDPVSSFGGIIGFNQSVDENTAKLLADSFYEVVVAPSFDESALLILSKKKNLRLLAVGGLDKKLPSQGYSLRKVVGGLLVQDRDVTEENVHNSKIVTKRMPTEDEWKALDFAWRICKFVKSNAIVYATKDQILGVGAGQMSRVDSSKIAAIKMNETHLNKLKPIVVASDAFFPFRDGIDAAANAGATAVIQPGGSIKDEEVIAAANERDMAMLFTGVRHFRH